MTKKTNLKALPLIVILFAGMAPTIAAGGIIYVDADAPGSNNGSSWADAYNYLQDALAVADPCDEIWVAEGTYKPDADTVNPTGTGERTETFQLINGMAIYGGYAGYWAPDPNARNIELYKTILSGDINTPGDSADNSYHVVTGSGTDVNTVLDGFTITAGNSTEYWPPSCSRGGGMYNSEGSPTVRNCTFSGNMAQYGGGMTDCNNSNPAIMNCTFINNAAILDFMMMAGRGGGMWNAEGSSPTLENCTFMANSADAGAGMLNYGGTPEVNKCTFTENLASMGGGMFNQSSTPTVTNCAFSVNSGSFQGGGMFNYNADHASDATVVNCTFSRNSAPVGGGMYSENWSSPVLVNCAFTANSATGTQSWEGGGGMFNGADCDPTLTNCTFTENTAVSVGGAIKNYTNCHPTVANCVLWGDSPQEIHDDASSLTTVSYSDVQGGWGGTGNISSDPLFIGPNGLDGIPGTADDEDDNFHLRGYSPCINVGDPAGNYSGQVDLDSQPRVAYGRVDIGADEVFPVAGDFEPDGDVDFLDFAIFANNWLLGAE